MTKPASGIRPIIALAVVLSAAAPTTAQQPPRSSSPVNTDTARWSVRMADAVMRRHPKVHPKWDYVAGVALLAIEQVGQQTGERRFADYVVRNMNEFVQPDGSIPTYRLEEFNLDQVNQGKVLFELYARTGDRRYPAAARQLREQLRRQPRTSEGGWWHKQIYPQQMWLDGSYMASPFLARYGRELEEPAAFDEVTRQVLLMARHARDPHTGLYYHGWDESRSQVWADSISGLSPHFWGRALGWYAMALVDILEVLPADHRDRLAVERLLRDLAPAIARAQDPLTGLWYQILDQPNRVGNYFEASASCMFVYALAKAVRLGIIDRDQLEVARRGFQGIRERFIVVGADGLPSLDGIVSVGGLGGPQQRDGSFAYYISEPVVRDDFKGVGPFIFAALELERAQ